MKFVVEYHNVKSGVKHAAPLSKEIMDILKSYNNIIWRIDGLKAIKGGRVVGEIKA
jgi:hypothetical protein